jgi:hypothetical protein
MTREALPVKVWLDMKGDSFIVQLLVDERDIHLRVGDAIVVEHKFAETLPNVHAYIERKEL